MSPLFEFETFSCHILNGHVILKVYKVVVKLPDGRNYFIFRRYNEFYNLYEKVSFNFSLVIILFLSSVNLSDVRQGTQEKRSDPWHVGLPYLISEFLLYTNKKQFSVVTLAR